MVQVRGMKTSIFCKSGLIKQSAFLVGAQGAACAAGSRWGGARAPKVKKNFSKTLTFFENWHIIYLLVSQMVASQS